MICTLHETWVQHRCENNLYSPSSLGKGLHNARFQGWGWPGQAGSKSGWCPKHARGRASPWNYSFLKKGINFEQLPIIKYTKIQGDSHGQMQHYWLKRPVLGHRTPSACSGIHMKGNLLQNKTTASALNYPDSSFKKSRGKLWSKDVWTHLCEQLCKSGWWK